MKESLQVGFCGIYPFRPHFEHLEYLARLMESAGAGVTYLSCNSSKHVCYAKIFKGDLSRWQCLRCFAGGAHSYRKGGIHPVTDAHSEVPLAPQEIDRNLISSSAALMRVESQDEWNEPDLIACRAQMQAVYSNAFHSAVNWISECDLDFVVCFNGRMDMTRAVTHACEKTGTPYVTCERTWFGDGLRLIPNANCLSIKALSRMVAEFDDRPLLKGQWVRAGKLLAQRFTRQNTLEWRLYNPEAQSVGWPTSTSNEKVLVLPSSKNEFAGHEEWVTEWASNTEALETFFEVCGIRKDQVVLRCHPNWAERIGKTFGRRSEEHYLGWARRMGITCIGSEEKADTYGLIGQADMVVLNGGSSAVEAGACGKKVVCLGPATYQDASFCRTLRGYAEIQTFDPAAQWPKPEEVVARTLRYVYLRAARFPQYVPYVRALTTTRYAYFEGADPRRLISMALSGEVQPDDDRFAEDEGNEQTAVSLVMNRQWQDILALGDEEPQTGARLEIGRRPLFGWVDRVRDFFPRGDR